VLAGGVTYMSCLVNAMARHAPNWRFDVYTGGGDLEGRLDGLPNLRVHRPPAWVKSSGLRFLYRQVVLPLRILSQPADALLVQFPGLFLADRPQVMIAMNSHYVMEPPIAPNWRAAQRRRVQRTIFSLGYRCCAQTVYVSHQMAALGRRFVGADPGRFQVIYEAAAPRFTAYAATLPIYERRITQPYFLAVGTVSPHKNYEAMLRAFGQVAKARGDVRLKIAGWFGPLAEYRAGRGPKPRFIALVEELGIADRVEFLGMVTDEQLCELFRDCLAFVSTSLIEAFNLTVVEAMAFGVPMVVPNTSAYPEQCGDSALYADPSDPRAVAEQMLRLANDDAARLAYARRSSERGRRYSWERAAEQYVEILERVSPHRGLPRNPMS
jgi:glycosyltransferase involved in cell wall biosynthesis